MKHTVTAIIATIMLAMIAGMVVYKARNDYNNRLEEKRNTEIERLEKLKEECFAMWPASPVYYEACLRGE